MKCQELSEKGVVVVCKMYRPAYTVCVLGIMFLPRLARFYFPTRQQRDTLYVMSILDSQSAVCLDYLAGYVSRIIAQKKRRDSRDFMHIPKSSCRNALQHR